MNTYDLKIPWSVVEIGGGETPNIIDIPDCYGVGLCGYLPPGAVAVVVPYGRRAELVRYYIAGGYEYTGYRDLSTADYEMSDAWPDGAIILHPGECVKFGEEKGRYSCFVNTPWFFAQDAYGHRNRIPFPKPFIRVFNCQRVPDKIKYSKVPLYHVWEDFSSGSNFAAPPSDYSGGNGFSYAHCYIPLESKYCRISFVAYNGTNYPVRLAGGYGPVDREIWWLNQDMGWIHHEADDFDVAGRGQLSDTHYTETYELMSGVTAVRIVGTNIQEYINFVISR